MMELFGDRFVGGFPLSTCAEFFRKTNISNLLICKGVRNVIFSENFAYVLNDSKYVSLECCI